MYQGYEGIKSSTIPIFPLNATVVCVVLNKILNMCNEFRYVEVCNAKLRVLVLHILK